MIRASNKDLHILSLYRIMILISVYFCHILIIRILYSFKRFITYNYIKALCRVHIFGFFVYLFLGQVYYWHADEFFGNFYAVCFVRKQICCIRCKNSKK